MQRNYFCVRYKLISSIYGRISFTSRANPEGVIFWKVVKLLFESWSVSHKSTSGAGQSGEIMKVLCQVQSLSLLPRAWSFTHLWPINTAWVNMTVCSWNLCLTLVSWREKLRHGVYISSWTFSSKCVFAKTENTVHGSPLQRRFWRMPSRAWGYLCGILLMESIFGCDLIFTSASPTQ